jgi:hypothetical protein
LIRKNSALCIAGSAIFIFSNAGAIEAPKFQTGLKMGYNYGQNGGGWPEASDPLNNRGRGGFNVSMLRLKASVALDSTFSAVAVGNLLWADLQEIYLEKRVRNYTFTAGKFRGAGLKSGSGTDEFERTTVNAPLYARYWNYYKRMNNFRDFGVQAEADYYGGEVKHRLYFHNANRENVIVDEPSNYAVTTQALGIDYALDWRISPFTQWGATLGALANRGWSEFAGNHEGWQAGYWFKTNPLVDASLNHQLDMGRFHMFNEAMILYNREIPDPVDSGATKTWGVSSQLRFDHSARNGSVFKYEFFDNTDGAIADDALHLFTLGWLFHPSPDKFPGLKITGEYVRVLEEGAMNELSNDVIYAQLDFVF